MAQSSVNILMTGAGAPGAPGILRCLQQETSFHITVADANPHATGRYLTRDFETIPMANDPDFIEKTLAICKKRRIHVLMPLVTRELIPLAEHCGQFVAAGIKPLVSPAPSLDIANNKSKLYQFLQWRNIPVPAFRIVENADQFRMAIEELGYPSKPVCFKPSVSNGSRGFRVLSEKTDELDHLFNQKPNSTFITAREAMRIFTTGSIPELLVSEFLPGEEWSVDCLCHKGDSVLVVPRTRKRMINGISVEGEFIKDENIINYCSIIIKELQLEGNIGIQVKRSAAGQCLILEINPRVQGTISAALGAGVNLPVLAVKQALDLPVPEAALKVKWGTRFSRYWNEVFY